MKTINILKWDSDFFGFPIAKIKFKKLNRKITRNVISECRKAHIKCLYFEAGLDDYITHYFAIKNLFQYVDTKVKFEKILIPKKTIRIAPEIKIRLFRQQDYKFLLSAIKQLSKFSRFYFDVKFSKDAVKRLYKTWFAKGYPDKVFVATYQEVPCGFLTCKIIKDTGKIDLIAVNKKHRNLGIGGKLINTCEKWLLQKGINKLIVNSQCRNVKAMRFYQQCGFFISSVSVFYHRWF